jgi:hypothetical protein
VSSNKHLSDHFYILDLSFCHHLLNISSLVVISECSKIPYRLKEIRRERMDSIQEHVLRYSTSSIRTLDAHILIKLDLFASQFIRITCCKEDHVVWKTPSKQLPIGKDLTNKT